MVRYFPSNYVCPLRFSEFPTVLVNSDGNIIWLWFTTLQFDTATFELVANYDQKSR